MLGEVAVPCPVGAARKIGYPRVPLRGVVGDGAIHVEVVQVAGDVHIVAAGGVVHNQACGVQRLGLEVEVGQPLTVFRVAPQVGAPVLVDERPREYRGMVAVALDHRAQRRFGARRRRIGEERVVGNLRPDQHAQSISHIVVGGVLHLDVDAHAVEAEFLELVDLVLEQFHTGRCVDCLGVVALIEHASQVDRFTVQVDAAIARLNCAEAAVVGDSMCDCAVDRQCHYHAVETGRAGAPELGIVHLRHAPPLGIERGASHSAAAGSMHRCGEHRAGGQRPRELRRNHN